MSKNTTLSVIIPAYNAETYIDNCLKSVMLQQNASFEVILVNDGSLDNTSQICKKWATMYSNILYLEQENRGQGTARNVAIERATGEWLVFLDADDELLPGAMEYLERNISEDYDIFWYGSISILEDGTLQRRQIAANTGDKKKIMQRMNTELWDKMFRTTLWKKERIKLSNYYGEDIYAVYMLGAKAKAIRTLQIPLILHYQRDDNLTSKPWKVMQITQSIQYVLEEFSDRLLFEDYRIPLFFMLMAQHKAYRCKWELTHQQESEKIMHELDGLIKHYFSEECLWVFAAEEEALVVIGSIDSTLSEVLQIRDIYCFECMEHFLIHIDIIEDKICHFIVNVDNEMGAMAEQRKSLNWSLSRWRMQCEELLSVRKARDLKGCLILYPSKRKEGELIEYYEKICRDVWRCETIEASAHIWKKLNGWRNTEESLNAKKESKLFVEITERFNYRWENLKLEYNVNLLCSWVNLKQHGGELGIYFREKGYQNIAIYGMGYLGRLLLNELKYSGVDILYLIDMDNKQRADFPLYSPKDILPVADVIVVSVIHHYRYIRSQIKCACQVVSLQEIVEWCSMRCNEQ